MNEQNCGPDGCEIDYEKIEQESKMFQGLYGESLQKLKRWLNMEPMDYDAPGTTVQETGV